MEVDCREASLVDRNELAVKQAQDRRDAGRPVTVGRLHAADAQINAAKEFPTPKGSTP